MQQLKKVSLIGAVTKYAAAKEGLTRGLNMSQAEIDRTDWDKKIDQAMAEYNQDYKDLSTVFKEEDKAKALTDAQKAKLKSEGLSLKGKIASLQAQRERLAAKAD
jgi:uncharacterized protein YecT (DUF1311 family)